MINSYFLITKCLYLYVLCKEMLGIDNWLELKGLNPDYVDYKSKGS